MLDLFAPDQHLKKMPIAGTEQKHKKSGPVPTLAQHQWS